MSRNKLALAGACLALTGAAAAGSGPRLWVLAGAEALGPGEAEGVALDSEIGLMLGPATTLLLDTESPRVWAMTTDTAGNVYLAVGESGEVVRRAPDGQASGFVTVPDGAAQALAWGPDGYLYVGAGAKRGIYRVPANHTSADDRPELWHPLEAEYVWDLEFDAAGTLYVAAGEPAGIHAIRPDGTVELIYAGNEAHVRTLLVSGDTLYAGTADSGLVLRVGPDRDLTVLYDAPESEITGLAMISGALIVASHGAAPATPGAAAAAGAAAPAAAPKESGAVYRVHDDGFAEPLWRGVDEGVHAIAAFDDAVVIGTGPNGRLVRITVDGSFRRLGRLGGSHVVALRAEGGQLLAVTSNLGRLYSVGRSFAPTGTYTSPPKDTGSPAWWGSIRWRARLPQGSAVEILTRSGNAGSPDDTWSDWRALTSTDGGHAVASPPARFLQWQARLASANGSSSPTLDRIEVTYVPRNVAPKIETFVVHPAGVVYRQNATFEDGLPYAQLPPSVEALLRESEPGSQSVNGTGRAFLGRPLYVSGLRTLSWDAADPNGDPVRFDLEIRAEDEVAWKPLAVGLTESPYTLETGRVPDGLYQVRLWASDAAGNPRGAEQRSSKVSPSFMIDNTAPIFDDLVATVAGTDVSVVGSVHDVSSLIGGVEYSLNGGAWQQVVPADGYLDSPRERLAIRVEALAPGEHTIVVRASDTALNRVAGRVVFDVR